MFLSRCSWLILLSLLLTGMKNCLLILSLCFCLASFGQNLIPNGSFETYSSLPTDLGQYALVSSWSNCSSSTGDPDFYHTNGALLADLPVTSVADIPAYDGEAIMGFTATGKKGSNFREYLNVRLPNALSQGQKYKMTFKVSNGSTFDYSLSGLGTSNFGVAFSVNQLVQTDNDPINVIPEFETFNVLFDRGWKTISFSFTADDDFEWITLGVFNDDSDLDIEFKEGNSSLAEYAYYFVDDFTLENIPSGMEQTSNDRNDIAIEINDSQSEFPFYVPNAFTPDNNGNNDSFEIVQGRRNVKYHITVYDRWGTEIYSANQGKPAWDGKCNGKPCPSDIYVWHIAYSYLNDEGEEITDEETGTIHLIK